jgi:hypothetical protein
MARDRWTSAGSSRHVRRPAVGSRDRQDHDDEAYQASFRRIALITERDRSRQDARDDISRHARQPSIHRSAAHADGLPRAHTASNSAQTDRHAGTMERSTVDRSKATSEPVFSSVFTFCTGQASADAIGLIFHRTRVGPHAPRPRPKRYAGRDVRRSKPSVSETRECASPRGTGIAPDGPVP